MRPWIGKHLRSNLLVQFPAGPVRGLYLAVEQEVLLGGHVVKENVILHANTQIFADVIQVCLHVSTVHFDTAGRWCKETREEGPDRTEKCHISKIR